MQRDDYHEARSCCEYENRTRFRLQLAQGHVCDQQRVGHVNQHMQTLPHGRSKVPQPEIVAGRSHQEQNHQCGKTELLKGEIAEA